MLYLRFSVFFDRTHLTITLQPASAGHGSFLGAMNPTNQAH